MGQAENNQAQQILLVDDDPLVRSVIQDFLHQLGHEVVTAEDGRQAIDLFQRMQPSICLLITDIHMPVMDGVSLIREVRQLDARLPIAVITGYADEPMLHSIRQHKTAVFKKPVRFSTLESLLNQLLGAD